MKNHLPTEKQPLQEPYFFDVLKLSSLPLNYQKAFLTNVNAGLWDVNGTIIMNKTNGYIEYTTILYETCKNNDTSTAKLLLEECSEKIDVNKPLWNNSNLRIQHPIIATIINGNIEILNLFLKMKNVSLEVISETSELEGDLLFWSVSNGCHENQEMIVKTLIETGSKFDFNRALNKAIWEPVSHGIIKLLLDKIDDISNFSYTSAISNNKDGEKILGYFVEKCCKIKNDNLKTSLLNEAIKLKSEEHIKTLIKSGAKITESGKKIYYQNFSKPFIENEIIIKELTDVNLNKRENKKVNNKSNKKIKFTNEIKLNENVEFTNEIKSIDNPTNLTGDQESLIIDEN